MKTPLLENTDRILGATEHLAQCLVEITNSYCALAPGKTSTDFTREIFSHLNSFQFLSTELIIQEVKDPKNKEKAVAPYAPVVIACIACIQALRFLERNETESAWSRITEARYWTAVCKMNAAFPELQEQLMGIARRPIAAKGGVVKGEKHWGPTRTEAERLGRERGGPNGRGRVPSANEVAERIVTEVNAFALKNELPPVVASTIRGWLLELPDADALFKRKPSH